MLQREGGWCEPLAKIAEVALEWCRGRGAIFAPCVVDNGCHRYRSRVCILVPFRYGCKIRWYRVLPRPDDGRGGFFFCQKINGYKFQEVYSNGSVQRTAQNIRAVGV